MSFIDASIQKIAGVVQSDYVRWETASKRGLFQSLDPRIKVLFMIYFIVLVSLMKSVYAELGMALFIMMLIGLSRLNLFHMYKRIIGLAFFFGFLIALPSAFNVITRGEIIIPVASLSASYKFWIYSIPREIGLTREGCHGVALLTLRVMNSVGISLLVIHTTPFFEIIRALKVVKVPDTFLMVIILSYKFIFIFSKTVEEIYLAMKSRLAGPVNSAAIRELVAGRIYFLFKKSQMRYEETCLAMEARGFSGEMTLYSYRTFTVKDAAAGLALAAAGILLMVLQRIT